MTLDEQIDECEKLLRSPANKGQILLLRKRLFALKAEKIRLESGQPKYKAQSIK